jgi:hypothetical protein
MSYCEKHHGAKPYSIGRGLTTVLLIVGTAASTVLGQWLSYPTPGLPRTTDGKPNLSAPAPKTSDGKPDFSGVWQMNPGLGYGMNMASDLRLDEIQPWAESLFEQRSLTFGNDDPLSVECLPLGIRSINGGIGTLISKIIQTSGLIVILFENMEYRQIFLDGRDLPKDPNPTFMGYSVGRWDGDTLVVESNGFNERTWLDFGGHPHTESLRITERWRRADLGHMDVQVAFVDPKAYKRSWTVPVRVNLRPDTDLLEYVCNENQRDAAHLVGRTEEESKRSVAPAILSSYAGTYVARSGAPFRSLDVMVSQGKLILDIDGKGKLLLMPQTDSSFTFRLATIEFFKDTEGNLSHLMFANIRADRRR